ncbi:MAG: glycosyltransferase family 2 protein [Zwartia sp.]|uniref:glycosyltransferase family 2 protein n=1 Tax=Zwartia sp. TaxID=2978004 RepID=UPI003C7268D2
MADFQLTTPVALLIFNRPDTTERVFREIAKAKPPKLLVVADGPRANRAGEYEKCQQTRAIIQKVDWDCEVITNFSENNMGCKLRVASGIDWIFEQVEEAIILEDDCLPEPSFFQFCEEMLERYRNNDRVSMISGGNLQFGRQRGLGSYYFSRYTHIWGWASWRRAWQHYDRDIKQWPQFRDEGWIESLFPNKGEQEYWRNSFEMVYNGSLDTWDCSWTFTALLKGMLQIVPNVNLISNIGFGPEATHTHEVGIHANMPTQPIAFPLVHPNFVLQDPEGDRFISEDQIAPSFIKRQLRKINKQFSRLIK